jgi:hypothetical protein
MNMQAKNKVMVVSFLIVVPLSLTRRQAKPALHQSKAVRLCDADCVQYL